MEPIKNIEITKEVVQTTKIKTEEKDGLRFAVVYQHESPNAVVIGLFDSSYWAKCFRDTTSLGNDLTIINVTNGEVV
ncbi:hypothetical protein [Pyruvatibacter sp.]